MDSSVDSSIIEDIARTETPQLYVAQTWRRAFAQIIDGLVLCLPYVLCYVLGRSHFDLDRKEAFLSWPTYVSIILCSVLYQLLMLKRYSRTVGKMAMNLVITDAQTGLPGLTWRQIILRLLVGMTSVIFSILPNVTALFRSDRRSVQDLIAGTQVRQSISREPAKPRWIIGTLILLLTLLSVYRNLRFYSHQMRFTTEGLYQSLELT